MCCGPFGTGREGGWDIGEPNPWGLQGPESQTIHRWTTWKVAVYWQVVPTQLTHLLARPQSRLKGESVPASAPLGVRVEGKGTQQSCLWNAALCAGPSRPRIRQVLSGLGRRGVRCVSESEAGIGLVGWEGEGGEQGSGGGCMWGLVREISLNKMNICC